MAYRDQNLHLHAAALSASLQAQPEALLLPNFTLTALGGSLRGKLDLQHWRTLRIAAEARNVSLRDLAHVRYSNPIDLDARLSGPMHLEATLAHGFHATVVDAKLNVEPAPTGLSARGAIEAVYRQTPAGFTLLPSTLDLGSTHLEAAGTLGENLTVHAASRNLHDLLQALPLAGQSIPKDLPVSLQGTARFDGVISGPLTDPRISGQADLTQFATRGNAFDHLAGNFVLTRSLVSASRSSSRKGRCIWKAPAASASSTGRPPMPARSTLPSR